MKFAGIALVLAVAFWAGGCGDDSSTDSLHYVLVIDTLPVVEDARIQSDVPDGQYGAAAELVVVKVVYSGGYTVEYRSLVKLPSLPDSVAIGSLERATLILHYTGQDSSRAVPVAVYAVDSAWSEASVSWNMKPAASDVSFANGLVARKLLRVGVWGIYHAGTGSKGIMLATNDGTEQGFHSSEAPDPKLRPAVEYAYRVRR